MAMDNAREKSYFHPGTEARVPGTDYFPLNLLSAHSRLNRSVRTSILITVTCTFKAFLAFNVAAQVAFHLILASGSHDMIADQFDIFTGVCLTALQGSDVRTRDGTSGVAPVHALYLKTTCVTAAFDAVVRGALSDSPRLLCVV